MAYQHGLGFKWSCFSWSGQSLGLVWAKFGLGLGKVWAWSGQSFDTIDHEILMNKFYLYGVKGSASRRFQSYLTHREQVRKIDKYNIDTKECQMWHSPGIKSWASPVFIIYERSSEWTFPLLHEILRIQNRQKYHHSLKEHPKFSKIAEFGFEML